MTDPGREYTVRQYSADDEQQVVDLWNLCLVRDEIALNSFRRKVVLDTNFDSRGCFVAVARERIVGFMLGIRRRYPYFDVGLEPEKGWITAFFVHPDWRGKGIATDLVQHTEQFLVSCGARDVFVADYTPNYFFPGVDVDAYKEGFDFLSARGYKKLQNVYGMGRSLIDASIPGEIEERFAQLVKAGFSVTVFRPAYTLRVLEFLRAYYPGDLFRVAHDRLLEEPECDEILVGLKDGEVVGFSHFHDERFGPFGIAPDFAGRGFGPMLYYCTVEQMRKKGKRNLWLAWTSGRAKDFYYKVGLRVTRRHVIMSKRLTTP